MIMEFMIAWFWVLKLLVAIITLYVCYIAFIKRKFSSKYLNIVAFFLLLVLWVSPIKLDSNVTNTQNNANNRIEQLRRQLPEKVMDDTFKQEVSKDIGIKEKDLN